MARGTQHRKRRPAPNARAVTAAAAPRKQKPPQWQEQLFFARLRVHAKWMFVFLALVFGLGFVFLGIGSGSTGISEALQSAFHFGGSGGTSISSLQHKVEKSPNDAQAWRDLATALEQKQRTQDAIDALTRYTALRPKDSSALAELAAQYSSLADGYYQDYVNAEALASSQSSPGSAFAPPASTPLGRAFSDPSELQDPLATAVQTLSRTKLQTALTNYQSAQGNAEVAYRKIAALDPSDATSQIQLGQAAQAAGDTGTAIAAFKRFLKLAPGDPLAPRVKQALKELQAAAATSGSTSR